MKKKIGLFGGSFNPPHLGHLHLAETVYSALELDEIRLIPARKPPHKSDRDYAPPQDRFAMCQLFSELHPWLIADDFELRQTQRNYSYTYYTIEYFKKKIPDCALFLVIGSDMLLSFTSWFQWQEILQSVSLACIAREDGETEQLTVQAEFLRQFGEIFLINTQSFAVSSTKIREMAEKNQNYSCYLPEKIVQYI
ncbi:MAG: nicotinate (nicotinamide) nucleotide adenylyltransferase, partial [Oscillospiraceae bacterium]|nr:nicotinate (nicotinamide) nucleotide adenylyltransferase [Oscillospiraceae bacterium]